jgi:hypothetical protein
MSLGSWSLQWAQGKLVCLVLLVGVVALPLVHLQGIL